MLYICDLAKSLYQVMADRFADDPDIHLTLKEFLARQPFAIEQKAKAKAKAKVAMANAKAKAQAKAAAEAAAAAAKKAAKNATKKEQKAAKKAAKKDKKAAKNKEVYTNAEWEAMFGVEDSSDDNAVPSL